MLSGQNDGIAILTRSLQQGCSEEEITLHLLNSRRLFLSERQGVVNWRQMRAFKWDQKSLKEWRPKYNGDPLLLPSTQGLFFHAYWNCIWGLSKPQGDQASQWVLIEVETKDNIHGGRLTELRPRYSNVEEISEVGKITSRDMLVEISILGGKWVDSCEGRLVGYKAIAEEFAAEDAVLRELARQAEDRIVEAIKCCRQGDFTGLSLLSQLSLSNRIPIKCNVTGVELAGWEEEAQRELLSKK